MNLSGGELADMLPTGDDPGNALLIQESFGPAEASNRRCHITSHSDPALRFARGEMTQAELAQRIGVTRQTIIAIEQGRYSPSLEMAFQTSRVCKVPLDEVFQYPDGEGEPP